MSAVVGCDDRKCPSCAELIKAEAMKCRFCGEMLNQPEVLVQPPQQPSAPVKKSRLGMWISLSPVFAFLGLLLFGYLQEATESPEQFARRTEKQAIRMCWDELKNQPYTTQEFVKETCQKMEQDFYQEYGRKP